MNKFKTLHVTTTQGQTGLLTRESQFIFNYTTDERACELGLTMPLTARSYAANILPGPLRQNLPEGHQREWIARNMGKTMKLDDFNIMAFVDHNMIGRARCFHSPDIPAAPQGEDLAELLAWKGTGELFEYLSQKYAATSGISGVQPKVLLPQRETGIGGIEKSSIKDSKYIVKTGGIDYDNLPENEHHCMTIAQQAGLDVPRFWLSDDREIFVVERFDLDDSGNYLGFEDMTSLMGLQNGEKYEKSYENVAMAIRLNASALHLPHSLSELFKSLVVSMVVRNGDANLKNFGMLYTHPAANDVRLSPIYDVVNTTTYIQKDVPALKMAKVKAWPDRDTLVEFGKAHCMIDKPELLIDSICTAANEYVPKIDTTDIWPKIKAQIDTACFSMSNGHIHGNGFTPGNDYSA